MKIIKKLFGFVLISAMLLSCAACGGDNTTPGTGDIGGDNSGGNTEDIGGGNTTPGTGDNNGDNTEGGYGDVIERPEIDMPETPAQIVYPEKPAEAPAAPEAGVKPSIAAYTPSATKSTYTITEEEGVTNVSYTSVSDWSYIYASVENYSAEYGNIKITIRNGSPAAERIAVQAVYYEAYDLGYAPVTVYLGEMAEGEQYVIAELSQNLITDASYQQVKGETVKDKTIIGFVIFVDSLPTFAPSTASGSFEIVNFEFLPDGDPALEDRYVKPVVDLGALTVESGSTYIPVTKYSADYTKYTLEVNGAAGTEVELAVRYTLDGKSAISTAQKVTLSGADETVEYDFGTLRPTEGNDDFTTQFVKNGEVDAIVVTPVAGAEVEIKAAAFVRTATDGAYVADSWSSSASSVNIVRATNGGNAKIEYMFYDSWYNFSVPVRKGTGVTGITLTIYAPDGLEHLGIGLTNNSALSSAGQNVGTFILRGASYLFNGADSATVGTIGSNEPNLVGVTETISYDEATKIYTISYDLTAAGFEDYTMTSLIFYLNCPDADEVKTAHMFNGTRSLYFLSIDLIVK